MIEEVTTTLTSLILLPTLDPPRVAEILTRRLEVTSESEAGIHYRLVGGPGVPFGPGELRWGRRRPGAFLYVEMARGLQLPLREVEAAWKAYPSSSMPPDPRCPDQRKLLIFKVPVGELRLLHPGWFEDYVLDAFAVSETCLIRWPTPEDSGR